MKRIILSFLMSCMVVQQAHGLFSELASGFALSTAAQAAYAGLNYWVPNSMTSPKMAVDAVYIVSSLLFYSGIIGGYAVGQARIVPPYGITHEQQQLEQLCYGVALGGLAGFAGCYAAKYGSGL